ncbi:MAG: helix-turn-helix transcriptional regulator [Oliverpabstia sp.]
MTSGNLNVKLNNDLLKLQKGNLLLIRPGDIHTKIECGPGEHINLAFPAYTIEALFRFLYDSPEKLNDLHTGSHAPVCTLSSLDTTLLQNRISYLNLLPSSSIRRKNTYLRTILTDVLFSYFMQEIEKRKKSSQMTNLPAWLEQAIDKLSSPENLERGMDYLVEQTNRTPEHICRAFRKYLGTTPMTYINTKKLNYAANLLQHSDKEIIDIAYESGFQSISNFYHLFKKEYQISPLKYRNQHHVSTDLG